MIGTVYSDRGKSTERDVDAHSSLYRYHQCEFLSLNINPLYFMAFFFDINPKDSRNDKKI